MMLYGQDKEGNEITFLDIIESEERSIDDEIDLKMKRITVYPILSSTLFSRALKRETALKSLRVWTKSVLM